MVPKVESAETLAHARRPHRAGRGGRRHRAGNDPPPRRSSRPRAGSSAARRSSRGASERVLTPSSALGDFSVALGVDLTPEATELALRALPRRRRRPGRGPGARRSTVPGSTSRTSRASRPTAGAPAGWASRAAWSSTRRRSSRCSARTRALSDEEADAAAASSRRSRRPRPRGSPRSSVDGRFVDYPIYRLREGPHRAATTPVGRPQRSRMTLDAAARSTACAWSTRRRCSPAP